MIFLMYLIGFQSPPSSRRAKDGAEMLSNAETSSVATIRRIVLLRSAEKPFLWLLIGGRAPVQGVVMEEGKVLPTTLRVVEEKCAQARSEAALDMF